LERGTLDDLCPEGGYRAQPRVSTLGTHKINELALKGREADLHLSLRQKLECAIETCYNWTYFRVVSTFDLPPLQGESLWAAGSQG
jgi:hypothetical protein